MPFSHVCTFVAWISLACVSAGAFAQTTPPPPPWERVEALKTGAGLHVKTAESIRCLFASAGADAITCAAPAGAAPRIIPRADIRKITISHRGRSTLVGMVIGAGVFAGIGAGSGSNNSFVPRGALAGILAIPGALIGAIVGAATDFTRSVVYRAH